MAREVRVTPAEVAAAKKIVERDSARGRTTPEIIRKIADVAAERPVIVRNPRSEVESTNRLTPSQPEGDAGNRIFRTRPEGEMSNRLFRSRSERGTGNRLLRRPGRPAEKGGLASQDLMPGAKDKPPTGPRFLMPGEKSKPPDGE